MPLWATTHNIVSVSWSDHLVFGEGDGRLNSIDALRRRMQSWREELGAGIAHSSLGTTFRLQREFSRAKQEYKQAAAALKKAREEALRRPLV